MTPDLKHFDGLWRMLRSSEEKIQDRKHEAHIDGECEEDCPLCDDLDNMAKYFCKQTEEK